MELYIFDMDGVLLKPNGYHRALQDTVRLAAQELGFGSITLTNEQIARFEALGIANEWHSGALCIAMLTLARQAGKENSQLELNSLFKAIAVQPISTAPLKRGEIAIAELAQLSGLSGEEAITLVQQAEQVDHSLTFNLFESMILGDQNFSDFHHKPALLKTESYLKLYDQKIISKDTAVELDRWLDHPTNGAAIMTNRPSYGPENFLGSPDALFGAELVGLTHMPLIGFGETSWLADQIGKPDTEVTKPNPEHALAAILAAIGWEIVESLEFSARSLREWDPAGLEILHGSQITVFEDTPAGVIAVQAAGELLNQFGLDVSIHAIGIATDPAKVTALEALGAEVFADINQPLADL